MSSMTSPPGKRAFCRFYAELNDFLPSERRGATLVRRFEASGSVKDLFESFGVPHPEVDLVLVNGTPVGFGHQVQDGDRLAIYPRFRRLDLGPAPRLRPPLPADVRFVLDVHLGRLAGYLRLAGFDAAYQNDAPDAALAASASTEARVLLTRDRELLKRRQVVWGYCVRETAPRRQLVEVLRHFDQAARLRPLARCGRCNGRLEPVAKAAIAHRLPPRIRRDHEGFHRCDGCGRVYWRGSHVASIERLLARVAERGERVR